MHIVENKSKSRAGKQIYNSVLLRQSYRENGKVKKRTIANLSHCTQEEILAMKLALKHKDDLASLGSLKESVELEEGLSVGAVWTVYRIAKELGIERALGSDFQGKLALWQVIARVIDQGSRLSAVRLAQVHAGCDVLDIKRGFDENDLYKNLSWLADNQERIERGIFLSRRGEEDIPNLFLYDVTSSYLEGENNYFADYGYSRDGKKGKKQIVIGLLCDKFGDPVSTSVFAGNTSDPKTFLPQVRKLSEVFGCKEVTFVGDRGMIKSGEIEGLKEEGFYYITAITKPQIESLIKEGVIQIGLFDSQLCEIENDWIRYILRRNPIRADEIAKTRLSKKGCVEKFLKKKNLYLAEHAKAKVSAAINEVNKKIKTLKIDKWLKVKEAGRGLELEQDEELLKRESLLDGCYVIKTNLTEEAADKEIVHNRYKDLTEVERAFRDCKTEHLEVRPVYVRTEKSTRGHVLVVMLAYMIIRKLRHLWAGLDMTVKEGLNQLSTLCSMEMKVKGQGSCLKIPRPRKSSRELLKALGISMPLVLPHRKVNVVTRRKLIERRKIL